MTPEIRLLLEKAKQSLDAAKSLQKDAYLSFAASRLYYAMFYVAQALLLSRGLTYTSHAAVIAAYGKEFAKTGDLDPRYHRWLITAQDVRNMGDYGVGVEVSSERCQEIVMWATVFLQDAQAYLE